MEDAQTYRKSSKKYYFCPDFFLKVDGKLLIYPFLAFLAPSEHSSIEKTTPPEKNHSPLHLTPRSIIWDHNKMSESYMKTIDFHWIWLQNLCFLEVFKVQSSQFLIIFAFTPLNRHFQQIYSTYNKM